MSRRPVLPWRTVRVFCADPSHATREAVVATFDDETGEWEERVPYSRQARRAAAEDRPPLPEADGDYDFAAMVAAVGPGPDGPSVTGRLVDDAPSSVMEAGWSGRQPRLRYELRCKLCTMTVPVRREKLVPVLEALARAGVPRVTLHGLAAILRK